MHKNNLLFLWCVSIAGYIVLYPIRALGRRIDLYCVGFTFGPTLTSDASFQITHSCPHELRHTIFITVCVNGLAQRSGSVMLEEVNLHHATNLSFMLTFNKHEKQGIANSIDVLNISWKPRGRFLFNCEGRGPQARRLYS